MLTPDAFLKTPLDAIFFDCDGTLSTIEGIDELAATNGVGNAVKMLTSKAMGLTGINPSLYQQRLELTHPTREQMQWLGEEYIRHLTPDAASVIQIFQNLKKPIYIISAGLTPAILILADYLKIEKSHIYAVDINFDTHGRYVGYAEDSVLTNTDGKRVILLDKILKKYPRIGYVGDGLNDCSVRDIVTQFVGYGGAYYRENIAELCQHYIKVPSLAPILPLMLTLNEVNMLSTSEKEIFQKGLNTW